MDPITAVGLASSIITFVEFGFKLVDGAREIHLSTTGKTAHNAQLRWSSQSSNSGRPVSPLPSNHTPRQRRKPPSTT